MAKGTKVRNNSAAVSSNIKSSGRDLVDALARETETETKRNILRGTKSGETYTVPGTGVQYRASAPGEAPANRTGDLASSYQSKVLSDVESVVFSNLKYAKIELGWGDIAPRPALKPASDTVMKSKGRIINAVTRQLQ